MKYCERCNKGPIIPTTTQEDGFTCCYNVCWECAWVLRADMKNQVQEFLKNQRRKGFK